jgi:hypothetical protein
VIENRQTESFGPARDGDADAAKAKNAEHLAAAQGACGQRERLFQPLSGAQITFGLRQTRRRVITVRPMATSATSSVSTSGVLVTTTPWRPAQAASIWS